jgi:hypothetical protein
LTLATCASRLRERYSFGVSDWRSVFGTAGAA